MKTIGLIGGMSWESTAEYYRMLNQGIGKRCGGLHSAKIIMHSVDFAPIEELMQQGDWQNIAAILRSTAISLEKSGADFLLICTNTMHKLADDVEDAVSVPLVHIADATAEVLMRDNVKTLGLLGTSFTMEHQFYRDRLHEKYGLRVLIPEKKDREIVNQIIFNELCRGKVLQDSKNEYLRIIYSLVAQGAECIVLGCTEIGLLVQQDDIDCILYDTTAIHAEKAVELSLK